jgi:hypothetical protein
MLVARLAKEVIDIDRGFCYSFIEMLLFPCRIKLCVGAWLVIMGFFAIFEKWRILLNCMR